MNVKVLVTAHTSRIEAAKKLCEQFDAAMFLDDGTLGEPGNTRAALRWAETQDASHIIILQDDAQPVDGFLELAAAAIAERPQHVISYYLGTGRPLQDRFAPLVAEADSTGARWIDFTRLVWGVAWSIPTSHLRSLNAWLDARQSTPTDTETGHWTRFNRIPVTHTWPSLADHADNGSLIHNRDEPRKAWRLTTCSQGVPSEPCCPHPV